LASKIKKIGCFFFLFTFSLLAGSVFFIFEKFCLFSLQGYVVEAPSADVEKRFWDLLPPECIRYWPVFVFKSSQIRASMEKIIPVQISTEAKGIGLFHTRIAYLEPWLMVEWRGSAWCLSDKGRMWSPELYSLGIPKAPLWKISESLNKHFDIGEPAAQSGVFKAMFSIDELKRFDDIFRAQSWYTNTEYISFDRRAGEYFFKLSIDLNGKKIILIINGEESKLREIDMLFKQIMTQINLDSKEIFIDMSYTDKIVVASAQEGSLK